MTEKLYTIREVVSQRTLGLAERKVRALIASGDLKAVNISRGTKSCWRIPQSAIDEYLNASESN